MDVSVIVPVYKGRKYIPVIQDSILANVDFSNAQGCCLDVELLFVNDYPEERIEVRKDESYQVEVLVNRENCGIHQSRVNGLDKAKGKYILFLDQDDEITSNHLYSQLMVIGDNDIVVGNGYRGEKGKYRKIYRSIKKQKLTCKETIYLKAANQIVSPGQCLIKKSSIPSAWKNNIIKDNGGDDLFLWLLMFENNRKFGINPECIYKHVDTGVNLSNDLDIMYRSSDNLISLAEKNGVLKEKTLYLYRRRIDYLKTVHECKGIKVLISSLLNLDICIAKLYAYFR